MASTTNVMYLALISLMFAPAARAQAPAMQSLRGAVQASFLEDLELPEAGFASENPFQSFQAAPAPEVGTASLPRTGAMRGSGLILTGYTADATAAGEGKLDVALESIYNAARETELKYTMGGKETFFSGVYAKSSEGYLSLYIRGFSPILYNVKRLIDRDKPLTIGGAKYRLSFGLNLRDLLGSSINIQSYDGRTTHYSFSMRQYLAAIWRVGHPLTIGGRAYKLFYYNEIDDQGKDPVRFSGSERLVVFTTQTGRDEYAPYYVEPSKIPTGNEMRIFELHGGTRVGLHMQGGTLEIFPNP